MLRALGPVWRSLHSSPSHTDSTAVQDVNHRGRWLLFAKQELVAEWADAAANVSRKIQMPCTQPTCTKALLHASYNAYGNRIPHVYTLTHTHTHIYIYIYIYIYI